jgi:hypothetical protein
MSDTSMEAYDIQRDKFEAFSFCPIPNGSYEAVARYLLCKDHVLRCNIRLWVGKYILWALASQYLLLSRPDLTTAIG